MQNRKKEASSEIIYEDKEIIGFKNIKPEAPIHLLFVPKSHMEWKDDFVEKDLLFLGRLISVAKKIAIRENVFSACKFIFNVGKTGEIPHIHVHLLGGWKKEIPINNI